MIRSLPLAVLTRRHCMPLPTSFVREFNLFTAYGFSSNVIQIDFKSESWFVWHLDGAIVGHFHLWHDHVSCKVTRAGRDVSGKRESRQARERDIVGATDARFQHSAAPDRDIS